MAHSDNTELEESALDLDAQRTRLLDLKAQLIRDIQVKEQQIAEDGDDLVPERGGVGNHMADDANETAEQETMITLQNAAQQQLSGVNEALARLDAGTYGTCANCGKEIPPGRLRARPASIYCIDCQQLADRGRI